MAYAPVVETSAASGDSNTITTGAIDTTGATLIVLAITWYTPSGSPTPTDSKSNTWTKLTEQVSAAFLGLSFWYAKNPTVGSGHTFSTGSPAATYPSIGVQAFSGAHLTAPFDLENGGTSTTSTTTQPGAITPSENNELVVSAVCNNGASFGTYSVDGSFSTPVQQAYVSGQHFGIGMAYLIQTTAGSANPTWTVSQTPTHSATIIASFKVAGGATTRPVKMAGDWGGFAGPSGGFAS